MNETVFLLGEYNRRAQLRRLGFVSSLDDLDALTGEVFIVIEDELGKLAEQKRKRDEKKNQRK